MLLAAIYVSPGHAWNVADFTELFSFRRKSLLAGDLNAKIQPFGHEITNLLYINAFEISTPQCPTLYSPAGNGDVLDIVVHKNVRLSEASVSDILDSNHIPIVFHLLDHVRTRNLSDLVDKFTDWERF
jgi:hypothetical protein